MSLVSTYVKATDGNFYRDPVQQGDGWFICFDDEDDPELVIADTCRLTPKEIFSLIEVKYNRLRPQGSCGGRLFKGKGLHARNWFFQLESPINPAFLRKGHTPIESIDSVFQGVVYDPAFKEKQK